MMGGIGMAASQTGGGLVSSPDFLGIDGGRMALSFGAGCAAAWAFISKFVAAPTRKALDKRIQELEESHARCEERALRLETMLWMHGPQQLRQDIQRVISEEHMEMRDRIVRGEGAHVTIVSQPSDGET